MHEVPNLRIIPGDPKSAFILHVPHSSRFIPDEVRKDILLHDDELKTELDEMTDSHTDSLAKAAADLCSIRPWIFLNTYSRLVIDPERFPDEREAMSAIGMGAVYTRTSSASALRVPDAAKERQLLDAYFVPYAKIFEDLVSRRLSDTGSVTIVDVHSYRVKEHINSLNSGLSRPRVCIGVDDFHTPPWLKQCAEKFFGQIGETAINQPYAGTYVPLKYYAKDARVTSVMMENRADTFLTAELDIAPGINLLAQALAGLVNTGYESNSSGKP